MYTLTSARRGGGGGSMVWQAWQGDNTGPAPLADVEGFYRELRERYPAATVIASTFDAFFTVASQPSIKAQLPHHSGEIEDGWIYGGAPFFAHPQPVMLTTEPCLTGVYICGTPVLAALWKDKKEDTVGVGSAKRPAEERAVSGGCAAPQRVHHVGSVQRLLALDESLRAAARQGARAHL
jgi:hypothetical protein